MGMLGCLSTLKAQRTHHLIRVPCLVLCNTRRTLPGSAPKPFSPSMVVLGGSLWLPFSYRDSPILLCLAYLDVLVSNRKPAFPSTHHRHTLLSLFFPFLYTFVSIRVRVDRLSFSSFALLEAFVKLPIIRGAFSLRPSFHSLRQVPYLRYLTSILATNGSCDPAHVLCAETDLQLLLRPSAICLSVSSTLNSRDHFWRQFKVGVGHRLLLSHSLVALL
jgi:hypothetical protein